MESLEKRFSELINSIFRQKTSRKEMVEFKNIIDELNDESISQFLEKEWIKYDPLEVSFQERKQTIKSRIDIVNKSKNKKKLVQKVNFWLRIAASVVIIFSAYWFLHKENTIENIYKQNIIITTQIGERVTIELPDGSEVQLNADSKLSYSPDFNHKKRIVNLEGEAYFNVKKSYPNKFTVKTTTHTVEVMGTQFIVQNYKSEDLFEVSLISGKVKVNKNVEPSNSITIKPNQKYIYNNKNQELTLKLTDLTSETAWLKGELIIREKPLYKAIIEIERFYGIKINEASISEIHHEAFTGSFKKGNVEDALKVIELLYPVKYKILTDSIVLISTKH